MGKILAAGALFRWHRNPLKWQRTMDTAMSKKG
jgi:hypothetical protein